ncbi:MAG: oligosaccharide flippase family protein [Chitinophagaceae bacterium]|nr:oligosaccharide flippase family protein [Chitinophagaceae bacterium]
MIKLSSLKNKHFLALAGNLVISVFSVLMMSLLYRALSKTDVGTWFFFLGFSGLADALRHGLLSTATVKFYAGKSKESGLEVLGSIWFLAILLCIAMMVLNAVAWAFTGSFQNPQMVLVIKWFGLTFLSSMPYTFTFWVLMAEERYELILWLRMVNNGTMLLIIAVLMFLNRMTLENLLILNFATNCLSSFFCFLWRLTYLRSIFKRKKAIIIELFNFGKYSLATNLSSTLLTSANTFIITFFLGPAALAIYNLPQRLMEIVELPLRSFVGTGMSAMASAMNNDRKAEVLVIFKKYAGLLTYAFIPIVLGGIIFADLAISILGGAKYHGTDAANIFRIYLIFSILYPLDRFNGVTLDIIHQPKANFQKVLVMLAVIVVGNIIGVTLLKNLYGIALAGPFVLFSGLIVGYYSLNKYLPYKNRDIFVVGWQESKNVLQSVFKKIVPGRGV